jgi:kynureninase
VTADDGEITRAEALAADATDPLSLLRDRFVLPPDTIYLLGNSLGALPAAAPQRFARVVEREWGEQLIGGWNAGWYAQPVALGDRLAPLIGAGPGEVVVADTTSVNVMKVVHAALALGRSDGRDILGYEAGLFPTDGYVTASVAAATGARSVALDIVDGRLPSPLPNGLAAVLLSHVDYRSGRLLDMATLTSELHARGVLAIWDLSHSAGAVPVRLDACDVDYAVGCTYKYLNAGPGAPAYVFVRDRLLAQTQIVPQGWFAHREPFAMDPTFAAAGDIRRMLVGTPPVVASAGIEASLDVFDEVDIDALRAKSLALTGLFVAVVRAAGIEVDVVTPMAADERGSQVSLRHPNAYEIVRAMHDRGVVGDFRAPDVMRFGFAPLYLRHVDAYDAAAVLVDVVRRGAWRDPRYAERAAVT